MCSPISMSWDKRRKCWLGWDMEKPQPRGVYNPKQELQTEKESVTFTPLLRKRPQIKWTGQGKAKVLQLKWRQGCLFSCLRHWPTRPNLSTPAERISKDAQFYLCAFQFRKVPLSSRGMHDNHSQEIKSLKKRMYIIISAKDDSLAKHSSPPLFYWETQPP